VVFCFSSLIGFLKIACGQFLKYDNKPIYLNQLSNISHMIEGSVAKTREKESRHMEVNMERKKMKCEQIYVRPHYIRKWALCVYVAHII